MRKDIKRKKIGFKEKHTSKCFLTASDDNGADILVIVVLAQRIVQLREKRATQSVQSFRPVQSDCVKSITS